MHPCGADLGQETENQSEKKEIPYEDLAVTTAFTKAHYGRKRRC